jgi:hypothetical protein
MSASVFHRAPLFVSDHQVLLAGDAQAVLEPTAPGSTGIARACGMPVRPFQAGYRLLAVHVRAGTSLAAAIAVTVAWDRTQARTRR